MDFDFSDYEDMDDFDVQEEENPTHEFTLKSRQADL